MKSCIKKIDGKQRKQMKQNKKVIHMQVPAIGGNNQLMFDPAQAVEKKCMCGSSLFEKLTRIMVVSRLSSGNRTGKDIRAEMPVYVCRECQAELGGDDLPKIKEQNNVNENI